MFHKVGVVMSEIKDGKSFFIVSRLLVSMRALMDIVPNNIPEEDMTVLININKLYQVELKDFVSVLGRYAHKVEDPELKKELESLLDFTVEMDDASSIKHMDLSNDNQASGGKSV